MQSCRCCAGPACSCAGRPSSGRTRGAGSGFRKPFRSCCGQALVAHNAFLRPSGAAEGRHVQQVATYQQQHPQPDCAVNYGLFSVAQARAAGFSRADMRRLVARGRWARVDRGILTVVGRQERSPDALLLAVLRAGPQAVASHESAASAFGWDLLRPPAALHLTVPAEQGRTRRLPGVVVHRSGGEVTTIDGVLGATSTCRTALDLAGTLPQLEAVVAVDSALRARSVRLADLKQALCARRTWDRAPHAARVLALASPLSGSVAETWARVLFAMAGLPAPVEQLGVRLEGVGEVRADFAWPACRLIVEIDGYEFHSGREVFVQDRRRQNALMLAGWTVLRFTMDDLRVYPDRIVTQVRAAVQGS